MEDQRQTMVTMPHIVPPNEDSEIFLSLAQISLDMFLKTNSQGKVKLMFEKQSDSVTKIYKLDSKSVEQIEVGELYYNILNNKIDFSGSILLSAASIADSLFFIDSYNGYVNKNSELILELCGKKVAHIYFDKEKHEFALLCTNRVSHFARNMLSTLVCLLNNCLILKANKSVFLEA